jgi:predicted dehydrogenase
MKQDGQPADARHVSRREFVKQSIGAAGLAGLGAQALSAAGADGTAAASTATGAVLGANESVGVAHVGIGIRGEILVRSTQALGSAARIVDVCDLYDGHFDRAKELLGDGIRTGRDYRRVLENKDVDAVVIAVPDHWHKPIALAAMAAGKDVYIEKPMTHRWEDGADIIAAAKKHGRIVQAGSQHVNNPCNERALEIIKSGKLGKITLIAGATHRNTGTGAWYYPVPPDASPQTIDWKQFIGSAPWHEFDAKRFFQWRLFWDYSGGLPTDLFVHMITATHALMGTDLMPSRVVGIGNTYNWHPREVPDSMTAIADYPAGFTLTMTSTANNNHAFPLLRIMGTEGTLEYFGTKLIYYAEPQLENYTYSTNHFSAAAKKQFAEMNDLDPQSMRPRATAGLKLAPPETIDTPGQDSTEVHLAKFYDSVKTRKEPVEDAAMGHRCATVGHMVNLSFKARKDALWDKEKEAVRV